jgi:hypothetical protein
MNHKKFYAFFIGGFIAISIIGSVSAQVGGGSGTIGTLDAWVSTSTPLGIVPRGDKNVILNNMANCNLDTDSQGKITCGTDASGAGGGSDFTHTAGTSYNATSTTLLFNNGFISSASSSVAGPLFVSDAVNASTTAHITGNTRIGADTLVTGYLNVGSQTAPANTTDGDLSFTRGYASSVLNVGISTFTAERATDIRAISTATAASAVIPNNFLNTIQSASDSGSTFRAINFQNTADAAAGVHLTGIEAGHFEGARFGANNSSKITSISGGVFWGAIQSSGAVATSTVTSVWGIQAIGATRTSGTGALAASTTLGADVTGISAGFATSTDVYGVRINNNAAGNHLTNTYGLDVAAQTRGTKNNYGLRIAAPSGGANNYALNLSSTAGTAAGGVTWGTDTNLYRSAANTLFTDDALTVSGVLNASTTAHISGQLSLGAGIHMPSASGINFEYPGTLTTWGIGRNFGTVTKSLVTSNSININAQAASGNTQGVVISGTSGNSIAEFSADGTIYARNTLGLASTSPWGVLSVEQKAAQSILKPTFVVGDTGTTSPFVFVNQKGGVNFGTNSNTAALGTLNVAGVGTSTFTGGIFADAFQTNLPSCDSLDTDASGAIICGADASGSGSFAWTHTAGENINATTSIIQFNNGFTSSASSSIAGNLWVSGGNIRGFADILDQSGRNVSKGASVTLATSTANGDATNFAAALALLPAAGGKIEVGCGAFSLGSNAGGIDRSFVEIVGQGQCTEFQYNYTTQGVGFFNSDPSTQRTSIRMKNFLIKQTNTAGNATCLDFSGFVYADIENVNCTGSKIGMIASTSNSFYNTISEGWVNISGTDSIGFSVSNSSNDNTFQNVKAITSSASKGFYIDAHSTHCFACSVETDAVIGMHIEDEGDDATIMGVYLEGNAINLQLENGAENIFVTGNIADADNTETGNVVNNGACAFTLNARVQYSTTRGNYTTSHGCTGENPLYQGFGTSTPWGLVSVDQDANHAKGKPVFVVADNGTSTPFLFVNQKGGVSVGTVDTSIGFGNMSVSGNLTVGSCTGCSTGTTTSLGTTGKFFSSFTGTSTMLGSLSLSHASNKCILCITPSGSVGTANAGVGEGALSIDNTLNLQSPGLNLTSDQAGVPSNPLAIIRSTSDSYNQGLLWLLGSSGNTGGAAYGLKIQDANPDWEMVETDTGTSTSEYEGDVNNDLFRINGRNVKDDSFDTIAWFARNDLGGLGLGGKFCLGCGFSYIDVPKLYVVGSSTPGDYFGIATSTGAHATNIGNIFKVDHNGKVGVGTTSPGTLLSVAGEASADRVSIFGTTASSTFSGKGLDITGGTNAINLGFDATNFTTLHTGSTGNFRITATGDMTINNTGNDLTINDLVRINVTSGSALDVDGAVQQMLVDTTNGRTVLGASTTPWTVLSVEQSAGQSPLKSTFVVADQGTSTPFLSVNQKGGISIGQLYSTSTIGDISVSNRIFAPSLSAGAAGDEDICYTPATGQLSNAGASTCIVSSIRFKDNVKDLDTGLAELMKLRPISYTLKGSDVEKIGLIAEEVEGVEPRLVFYEPDGVTPRGVSYEESTALLVKAVQEQQKTIDELKEQVNSLGGPIVEQQSFIEWLMRLFGWK